MATTAKAGARTAARRSKSRPSKTAPPKPPGGPQDAPAAKTDQGIDLKARALKVGPYPSETAYGFLPQRGDILWVQARVFGPDQSHAEAIRFQVIEVRDMFERPLTLQEILDNPQVPFARYLITGRDLGGGRLLTLPFLGPHLSAQHEHVRLHHHYAEPDDAEPTWWGSGQFFDPKKPFDRQVLVGIVGRLQQSIPEDLADFRFFPADPEDGDDETPAEE